MDSKREVLSNWAQMLGPLGVYLYVFSFAFPVKWDLPMFALVLAGLLSSMFGAQTASFSKSNKITSALVFFLAAMAVSIIYSVDRNRSLHLSFSFLPALLIFFLITEKFSSEKEFHLLYICFSVTALGISLGVLIIAAINDFDVLHHGSVHELAGSFSYIIVSRNDLEFLALMAPFSFVLAYRKPLSVVGAIAILSMVLSLLASVIFLSRGATLTFLISISAIAFLLRPRQAFWFCLLAALIFLAADAALGFPLLKRFYAIITGTEGITNGRTMLWRVVWDRFNEAPLLGHGPHTFRLFSEKAWPHNLYLEVIFGHGLLGFTAFLILLFFAGTAGWKMHRVKDSTHHFVVGALAALIGFCTSALFELTFLRIWVTITLFMILGIIVRLSSINTK